MRLLQFIVTGVENSYAVNSGSSQIGSMFHFLEIAHTHFSLTESVAQHHQSQRRVSKWGEKRGSSLEVSDMDVSAQNLH